MKQSLRVFTGFTMLLLVVFLLFQADDPLQLAPTNQNQRAANGSAGFSLNQEDPVPSGPIVGEIVIPDISDPLWEMTPATPEIALDRELNPRTHPGILLDGIPTLPDGEMDPLAESSQNPNGLTPPVSLSFEGISYATGGTGSPPDTVGAVGPNHYVQMVNGSIQIFNKSGVSVFGPVFSNTIWSGFGGACQTRNDGDPIVLYDRQADRWLVTQFTTASPYMICAAVSTTADPTGSYYRYAFNVATTIPDYFKFGVWPDAYYMSANESTYTAYAFDRASMLTGAAATYVKFTGQTNLLMPADLDGATAPPTGSPGIFYTFKDDSYHGGSDRIEVFNLTVNWATPASSTFTLVNTIPVSSYTYTVCGFFVLSCIPQNGTIRRLDPVSEWPMFRLAYRNFGTHQAMVGNFAVDVGSDRAGIRWFELRRTGVGAWSLYQEGTQAPADGIHRWMGSIAQDRQGNIALGYSASSGTLYPSIRYATRLASDPLGTLQSEVTLQTGGGSQTATHSRWGDYSAMDVDPSNDCTFWYTTEYFSTSGSQWRTRIGTFTIPECVAVPDYTLTTGDTVLDVCNPGSDSTLFTLGAQNGYSGNVTLSTTGLPVGANASFSVNPVAVPGNSSLTVTTAGTAAGSYPFTVNSTDGTLSHPQAMTLNVTAAAPAAPTLLSLANGTTGASTTPTLSWQAVAGSTNYILEISTSPTFNTIVYSVNVAATSHVVPTPLSSDTLYYWRVRAAANICGSGVNSAVWAFTTVGGPTTLPAICRNPGTAIPDNNTTGITDAMVVATTGTLTDLNVSMNIPHTWVGDLWITLTHVDTATTVSLVNRPTNGAGNCSGNNINLTLDSGAALQVQVNCTSGSNPTAAYTVGGSYRPAATLNSFNGQNLSGTWHLQVSDRAGADLGTLNQWCLIPTVASTPAARDYSDLDTGYGIAWHIGDGALRLGSNWTADTTFTLGNDDGNDDGITQTGGQWTTGNIVTLNATVTGGGGYLAGWFDWNDDGVFAAGEKAVAQNVVAGVNNISLTVGPYNPSSTATLKARFRLYDSEPLLGPTGIETPEGGAAAGEVEDYAWSFSPTAITLQAIGLSNPLAWGAGLVLGLVGVTGLVLWRRRQTL